MSEHDDDRQIGRILSRREALVLLGAAGVAMIPGCSPSSNETASGQGSTSSSLSGGGSSTTAAGVATTAPPATSAATTVPTPSCIVRPAQTEGPYFVDEKLDRSDIRSDPSTGSVKDGTPFKLLFRVAQVAGSGCTALSGATVDIWHTDATGVYSDVRDQGFDTRGQRFLRGYQTTDANGFVTFQTIHPGWYQGRAVHIHFKIRTGSKDFTSQLFFADTFNDQIFSQGAYAARGAQQLRNASDGIYRGGGDQLLLTPTKDGQGYAATFDIGLQL